MSQEIQYKFLDFITIQFSVERDEIDLEKSLIDEGIIDSFGLIEIVSFIEKEFDIVVQDDQMTMKNFGSVIKIVNFIEQELRKPSLPKVS